MPSKRKSIVQKKPSQAHIPPRGRKAGPSKLSNMASQTEEADQVIQDQDHFTALMQAINTCQTTLTGKMDIM